MALAILGIILGEAIPKIVIAILFVALLTILGFSFDYVVSHLEE